MSTGTRGWALGLYWGGIATGVLLPVAMEMAMEVGRQTRTLAQAIDGFYVRLFAPQEGVLMLTVLGGIPFLAFAIVALIQLGTAECRGHELAVRRRLGLQLAYLAMVALSIAGHHAIMNSRGSTAGLGFLFLPFFVVAAGVAAYALVRAIMRLRRGPAD
jgi:hypothetical protein